MKETFELDERPHFVQLASKDNQVLWEKLSITQKSLLESQASLRTLETPEQVNRFFETRDMGLLKTNSFVVARPENSMNESYDPITLAMRKLNS